MHGAKEGMDKKMAHAPSGGGHGGDRGPREGGRIDEWDVDDDAKGTPDGGHNDPWKDFMEVWDNTSRRVKWIACALIVAFMIFVGAALYDWRIAGLVVVPVGFVLLFIAVLMGAMSDKSVDHSKKKDGHGKEGGHHEGGHFLTRTPFFIMRELGPDDEVIWANRLLARRGAHEKRSADWGWYTSGLRLGRLAFGVPWLMEPEWVVDMSEKEQVFTFTANPGAEAMKVRLRVAVGVNRKNGQITPETARRLVTELDKEPWAAIKDRAQSGFQDMLARLDIQSSLDLEPAMWRRIETAMLEGAGEGRMPTFQDYLRHIGFRASVVEIQNVSSAVAEEHKEISHLHEAGVNPTAAYVARMVADAIGGRAKKGDKKKSGGRSGGGDSDRGHSDDEDEE